MAREKSRLLDRFYHGVLGLAAGCRRLPENLSLWKHILTASRRGDEDVRAKYLLNMALMAGMTLGCFILWSVVRQWLFVDFDPMKYWGHVGSFWTDIWPVALPTITYAFFLGQLDWFGSMDEHEEGTVVAESLPFKWAVSLSAGVFEELQHRGYLIFLGLLVVSITNLYFGWVVAAALVILTLVLLAKLEANGFVLLGVMGGVIYAIFSHKELFVNNAFLRMNRFIFDGLKALSGSGPWLYLFMLVLMGIFLSKALDRISMGEYVVRIVSFACWAGYIMPLGIQAVATMPIVPPHADQWTALTYVSAVLWSNAKFRDGHKYQGPSGMLNSYLIGFYMFYIAFAYGLLYAMAAHFLFDAVLFTSEHLVQTIKNRHYVRLQNRVPF